MFEEGKLDRNEKGNEHTKKIMETLTKKILIHEIKDLEKNVDKDIIRKALEDILSRY